MPDVRAEALALAQRLLRELDQRQAATATVIAQIDALMAVANQPPSNAEERRIKSSEKRRPSKSEHDH